jgi:hypothetical protein
LKAISSLRIGIIYSAYLRNLLPIASAMSDSKIDAYIFC